MYLFWLLWVITKLNCLKTLKKENCFVSQSSLSILTRIIVFKIFVMILKPFNIYQAAGHLLTVRVRWYYPYTKQVDYLKKHCIYSVILVLCLFFVLFFILLQAFPLVCAKWDKKSLSINRLDPNLILILTRTPGGC